MLRSYLALGAALIAAPAVAETASDAAAESTPQARAEQPKTNEEVIVVGQKDAPITVVPRGLSVSLGEEQFDAINAVNVEDLMKYAPNFFVRKRFAGDDNAVVALRGANTVQSARTIVLVDGFVVSNFLGNRYDYPPKWNVVGPSEVQQFDIVYGPYSARYGGNSMGGIISVTTLEPQGTSAYTTAQTMIMPFKEYGYDETFTGYSVESGGSWKQADGPWSIRGGFRHFENIGQSMTYNLLTPTSGAGTPVTGAFDDGRLATPVFGGASPTDVTQDQLRLRVGYETAGGWKIEGLGFAWKTGQVLTDTRSFLEDANGNPVYQGRVSYEGRSWNATGLTLSKTDRTEYLAGLKLAGPLAGWDLAGNLSHYWIPEQDARTSRDYLTGVSSGAGTRTIQDTPGWWTGYFTAERRLSEHKLALGFNSNLYETSQSTFGTSNWRSAASPIFSAATYGKTSLWGAWFEDAYDLGSSGFTLTGGIRYDRWRAFDGGIGSQSRGTRVDAHYASRSDDSISPKLSLQGRIAGNIDVQLSLGSAVRFPTVGELFQGRFDDISQQIDPQSFDPNLRPEKSKDANLIVARSFGKIRTTASLFYQDIDDVIFSFSGLNQFGTVITSYKNVDEVRQYGAEFIIEARDVLLDGLDVDANVAWTDAETVRNKSNPAAEGVQFPRIPTWRSNGNVRYRVADPVKLSLGWRYASRPNSDLYGLVRGDAYGFQSEYFTIDARASFDLTDKYQLSIGVDNLGNDQAYVSHPLPQRTYVADIKAKW